MTRSKIVKRILYGFLILLLLCTGLMLTPTAYSFLFPAKPPIGYHFLSSTYLALGVGLEDLIDTDPLVPEGLEVIKNIEYKKVDGNSLQLDIYKPRNLQGPAPLLIFVHGGGWVKGDRADMLALLVDFAERGYVTATVSYTLGSYPQCAEDVSDAVNWFYDHGEAYGYDPHRIALVGASAGAHLSMLAAYKDGDVTEGPDGVKNRPRIKAVVNIFGPVDLTTDFATHHPMVIRFISKTYEEAPELYKEASPIRYINEKAPPTMIIHGTSDELVPNSQADLLKEKLKSVGVPCADYRFPLWPHAMILVQGVYDYCLPKMEDFFKQYLNNRQDESQSAEQLIKN